MKTKTTHPEKANKVKAIFVAGLILIQASLIASDSSDVKKHLNPVKDAYTLSTEQPYALNAGNAYDYVYEEAYEPEMKIEDWMYNIQNDAFNSKVEEEEIELEEWMYNTHHSFWFDLDEADESELAIERWMTNPDEWMNTSDEILLTSK